MVRQGKQRVDETTPPSPRPTLEKNSICFLDNI